tara:strand:+ start:1590 stop:2483 length:894 start_codon:yes stop_codon:yes gene_type:complete
MFDHSKIDFQVEKFSLQARDGVPVPLNVGVGLRRKDNQQALAVVSEEYEPVQYNEIVSGVEEALAFARLDLTDATFTTNVYDNGSKLELRAKFPAHEMSMREDKDSIVPEFVFRTSHNRTWANSGMMGLWRGFCYNTLVSGDKLAYIYGRHTKNFNVSGFASKVKTAGEFISGEGLTQMRGWYDTKVSRDGAINLFTNTLAQRTDNVSRKKVANKVMLSNLMKIFDEENRHLHGQGAYEGYSKRDEGTLWSAYNAATYWSSHASSKTGANHNVRVTREDKVRKMLASPEWTSLEMAA